MNEHFARPPFDDLFAGCDPWQWLQSVDGEDFRRVPQRRTFRFRHAGEEWFAKLHHGVGVRELVKNLAVLRLPVFDATAERDALEVLRAIGVPVPEVMAWGVRGANPVHRTSWLVTRAAPSQITLDDVARRWSAAGVDSPPRKRALIQRVAEITRAMHAAGINHRDLYLVHFLLDETKDAITLIDLHRAAIRRAVPARWRIKDLAGLAFASRSAPLTRRDRLRFVRAYGGLPLREALRDTGSLWNPVQVRAERIWRRERERGSAPGERS